MKRESRVEIFGSSYIIKSETEEEYTRQLAKYVDDKMKEVAQGTSTMSGLKVAILAALNISNELFQLREEHEQQSDLVERKTTKLISILESRLEEAPANEKIA